MSRPVEPNKYGVLDEDKATNEAKTTNEADETNDTGEMNEEACADENSENASDGEAEEQSKASRLRVFLDGVKRVLLDTFFPQHLKCHGCNREAVVNEYGICRECEESLLFAAVPGGIAGVDDFVSGLNYYGPARSATISLKFNGALYKKEFLTHFMRVPSEWEADCIVPVPLSKKRLRSRGYNQSTVLAAVLAERYELPLREELLTRVKDTPAQSKLTAEERRNNLCGAFRADKECKGLSIILIDDVKTTGSTLYECARELKMHGAVRVYALTACCATEERRQP